jgi:asparagine synthase (glutamine-hydrolysing)
MTDSDSEIALHLYDEHGLDFVNHLRGEFALVLSDRRSGELIAARDRFGIKPLYFTHTDGSWEFASEIKQLAGESPRINIARARDFLLFGAQDHTAETMFDGIMQLRGGESLAIDLERPSAATPTSWYDLPPPGQFGANYEDATRAFREKFFDTVSLHMRSDVPVGFCLSGGMDSSALICTAGALTRESGHELCGIHCHYNVAKLDERQYAQDAATLAGARLIEVLPGPAELASELSTITRFQDEPLNNASLFSQSRVFRAAREHGLKVMVDGQGGDELLASYPQFFGPYLLGLLKGLKIPAFFAESAHFRKDHGWDWHNTLHSLALWFTPRPIFRAAKYLGWGMAHPWAKRDFFMG